MGLLGFERELKIYEGMVSLKRGPKRTGRAPRPRQNMCSLKERGTVLRAWPPNSTQATWTATVTMRMMMKRGLLKKLAKTLS